MRIPPASRRDRLRAHLADLEMPGALEALAEILHAINAGAITPAEAIERVLDAQMSLRNAQRLEAAMRSSRLVSGQDPRHLRLRLPARHQA